MSMPHEFFKSEIDNHVYIVSKHTNHIVYSWPKTF